MSNRLQDKTAVITGGASGIGLATAKRFAAEGAKVFITSKRQDGLDAAIAEIGCGAEGVLVDVANLSDLDSLYATIGQSMGRLDVVMANAVAGAMEPLGQITEDQVDAALHANIKGTLFTVQKALPLLTDSASIILTASTTSTRPGPGQTVYAATKAAVRNLARTWALELSGRGIRINALSPGPTKTHGLVAFIPGESEEAVLSSLAASVPLGRLANPDEIAAAALFLASDEASYVNGIEFFVDGGQAQV
jgi:NAD(P)-dependent dehydrogenase (short-subunit alcohol dehydrogenase family)